MKNSNIKMFYFMVETNFISSLAQFYFLMSKVVSYFFKIALRYLKKGILMCDE